ncbi:phosphotransferase [Actinoplanes sp. NPDC049596]|uniref:phosphotransferase family protein n=1 Tax=unclassified Actinoplanes TaxID=2626549 RepID=UPI00341EA28F
MVLVLEYVAGRNPHVPWQPEDLAAVLDALDGLAIRLPPSPIADMPSAEEALADPFSGWHRIAKSPPSDLDDWTVQHLPMLRRLADDALLAVNGDTLVHYDIRADNILLRPDGRVVIIDWPWACRGAAWIDTLMLLTSVAADSGHDLDALLGRGATAQADPAALTAVVAAQAGFTLDASRQPPPPGMGQLRPHQRAKAEALLRWLRRYLPIG